MFLINKSLSTNIQVILGCTSPVFVFHWLLFFLNLGFVFFLPMALKLFSIYLGFFSTTYLVFQTLTVCWKVKQIACQVFLCYKDKKIYNHLLVCGLFANSDVNKYDIAYSFSH